MSRIVFYSLIIVACIGVVILFDIAVYWGCRLCWQKRTAKRIHRWSLGLLLSIISIAGAWGHWVTRYQIDTKKIEVLLPLLPATFEGYRIAQLSDLHLDGFSDHRGHQFIDSLIQTVLALQPDLIVFTGDLVTLQSSEADTFVTSLSKLTATGIPVYSILGNHDYADYTSLTADRKAADVQRLCHLQQQAGWHVLRNEGTWIKKGNDSIALLGVENVGEPPFSTYGNLPRAIQGLGCQGTDSILQILLSHNPIHWRQEVLPQTNIQLMLAGHTHAAQFQWGHWSPVQYKYPEWHGLYRQGDQQLYVNTGIGGVGLPIRIGIEPEITILTLRCQP